MARERTERLVVLLRHGIAEERGTKPDEERALTSDGQKKMKDNATGLVELLPEIGIIITSPLVRCVQTALFVGRAAGVKERVRVSDALRPDASPEGYGDLIASAGAPVVVLVGHEPSLSRGLEALTGVRGDLELKKGGCYFVRQSGGSFKLEGMLSPRVLRRVKA